MARGRQYLAPAADHGVLAAPPAREVAAMVTANRALFAEARAQIAGQPLAEFRAEAQAEVTRAARDYLRERGEPAPELPREGAPYLVTGHQPELYHPGVWAKNFALNGLARRLGGVPLHLIVDNDTMKSASVKVPTWPGADRTRAHLEAVPFDRFPAEVPYEGRPVHDEAAFARFPEAVAGAAGNWPFTPLLAAAWPAAVALAGCPVGERFAAMRRSQERAWSCRNLELPVSRLAQTRAFARFAGHILAELPRFREAYNQAIRDYRRLNRVRSANHPAPELADGEAPFWRVNPGAAGHRVKAQHAPGAPLDPAALRPRALTLTLFARVALGDLFVHGIGGGKYDEVSDAVIPAFFGLPAPGYQVFTVTERLPLPPFPVDAADLRRLARRERDLAWNPQRHADAPGAAPLLAEREAALAAGPPPGRAARRAWYRRVREAVAALRAFTGRQAEAAAAERQAAEAEARANAVLRRRDAAWVLYPEAALKGAMTRFLDF